MQLIDLFSGIGGFSVAAHALGWQTRVFCEIMPFPQAVLRKNFPGVPIHDNIKTLTKQKLLDYGWNPNLPTVLTGGFPCQPFSVAGKRKGVDDDRYLWPEMLRVIQEAQPAWVVGENVGGFATMELDTGIAEVADQEGALVLFKKVAQQVIDDLNSIGYDVPRTDQGDPVLFVIPACAINAPHRRDRIWIVAHRNDDGQLAAEVGRRLHARDDRGSTRLNQAEQPAGCAVSGKPSAQNPDSAADGELQEQGCVGQLGNAGTGGHERHTGAADEGNATDSESIFLQGCLFRQREEQSRRGCNGNDANPDCKPDTPQRSSQKNENEWSENYGIEENGCKPSKRVDGLHGFSQHASNPHCTRFEEQHATTQSSGERQCTRMGTPQFRYWRDFPLEPPLHAGDDGLRSELVRLGCSNPDRVIQFQREEAIKGAGNAIVPWVALEIFKAISLVESSSKGCRLV